MQENSNSTNSDLNSRLPLHHPDNSLWNAIEQRLVVAEQEQAYLAKLQELPVHKPDNTLWHSIESRLGGVNYRSALLWTSAIAASFVLLIGIFNLLNKPNPVNHELSENIKESITSEQNSALQKTAPELIKTVASIPSKISPALTRRSKKNSNNNQDIINHLKISESEIAQKVVIPETETVAENALNAAIEIPGTDNYSNADNTSHVIKAGEIPIQLQDLTYNPEPDDNKSRIKSFSLGLEYLPEQVTANAGVAMINGIGVGATLSGDKFRVQTSIGLAYNKTNFNYDLSYSQVVKELVYLPGQGYDTLRREYKSDFSNLNSNEEHQYFTYNAGAGRKIISKGKLSAWLNAGAGIGVKLDKANNREETVSKIQHLDTYGNIEDIEIDLPSFNGYYFSLNSSLDFNYLILKRLSISIAPITRYYLQPVMITEGETPDKFSFGFTSGIKFKL